MGSFNIHTKRQTQPHSKAAENRYEEQISNLAVEKQELEWQKESLQHQYNALSSQHEEAMTVLKKQFQTRVTAVEEEKGKFQLTAESKEREISGLKEELKVLQVSKYSLEKKLNELEQKVQLQTVAKDNQLSQLSEVEKRFAAISRQCGLIKQAHEKLEQNVEEATRLNKKLIAVNKNQENAIHDLNQELEKVTADLIRSKVTSQCKLGEENIHLSARQQQLQELKLKLQMEVELNKRLSKNASAVQEEKQEVLKLFQHTQQLLQRQELALGRTEAELKVSGEKHQVLERDNERLREKAEENEDKFQNLQRENEKSTARWKKEETRLNEENQLIKSDLESFKEAHAKWQESHSKLPAHSVQQEQPMQIPQNNLKHFDQRTAQGTPGPQTSVTEALTATDNELKHAEIQNTTEEEIKEEPIERDYKKEGINNHSQDGMVNADNIVKNSNVLPPDTSEPAAEVPEKAPDNGALFVNERQYTSVTTGKVGSGEPEDIQQSETGNTCCEAESASAELNLQGSSVCLAEVPVEGGTMLSDSADALGVCSADVGQQTDSIAHKFNGGKSEALYDTNDKTKTTQCDKGVFITEARATPGTDGILAREVSANEVRGDTNQSASDLASQPVIHEIKNEQKSTFEQQHGPHSQADILLEENDANSDTVELCQLHNPCSKLDVSPTQLAADQRNHCVPSIVASKIDGSVDADNRLQSDISVESRDHGPTDREQDITEDISSNAQSSLVNTDVQQKGTNTPKSVISDSAATDDLHVTVPNAEALGILEHPQGSMPQKDDCISMTSNHSLNFTTHANHDVLLAPTSQNTKEADDSVNGSAATVESRQAVISKMGLHAAIGEARSASATTADEFKPIFISTSFNPVTAIVLDHRTNISTSEAKAANSKTTASQSWWKFPSLSSLDSSKGADVLNKATASFSISLPKDKLEAPVITRNVSSAFTFPSQIREMSLRRPCAADSPSPKRVNDTFNTSSVPLYPKRNSSEEWNAIAQTFYDFSRTPVQEKLCSSSTESFKIPYPPASMKHHGPFTESCSQPYFNPQSPRLSEVSTSNPMPKTTTEEFLFEDECDSQYFNIKGQINKIERFLSLDRFKSTRKRKADDSPDENAIKITLT
uniref:coiled-coil domain-containing protein 73 isoform X2 n=1 Tax=Pristiophorus japonicus TaxID=55135 RepID=UPI00398ED4C2